ncbi:hypothetical protein NP233_g2960 [Leucocoprinus birnbaumii]|uniref:gamma-glutamylcyclotransferase n=1 Tax=Leucocoprinus birnbaumii TaxID=56174 RepID=A0AAD5W175_9AGAR|nr:hypothetical protein NP233_g2960 [Leucocoprinus birnbaumii]
MALEPGVYRISNVEKNHPIGRFYLEDMSLLPKAVMTLPNVELQPLPPTVQVERGKNGYSLKVLGASTGLRDNSNEVAAVLVDCVGGKIIEWNVRSAGSDDRYYICDPENTDSVWTVKDEDAPHRAGEVMKSYSTYFGYGSNMSRRQMAVRCPDHQYLGLAYIEGWKWQINETGFPNIKRSPGDIVYGMVFKISETDEKNLDEYEDVPKDYSKEYHSVTFLGTDKSSPTKIEDEKH